MILQPRPTGLRLLRQHDHALAAGAIAHAWRTIGEGSGRLPHRLVLAVSLHDVAWRELDASPRLDPDTGRPYSFDTHPLDEKLRAYRTGLDRMAAVDPHVGLLGSLHYSSFVDEGSASEFLEHERDRRRRLARSAGPDGSDEAIRRARRELPWLQFLDHLSLRLCSSPPPVPDDELPPWMDRTSALEAPDGRSVTIEWDGEDAAVLDPWPLADDAVVLELPVRDLPERSYPDAAALEAAWRGAEDGLWRLRVRPG